MVSVGDRARQGGPNGGPCEPACRCGRNLAPRARVKNAVRPLFLAVALLACREPETSSSNQPQETATQTAQPGAPDPGTVAPVPPAETASSAPGTVPPAETASSAPGTVPPAATSSEAAQTPPRATPAACTPAPDRLCPVDETGSDPTLRAFRAKLLEAVREKSEAKLMPLVADDVRISFGDDNGVAAFRKRWRPSSPDSALWRELDAILSLGGSFRDEDGRKSFWAPYVYSEWPSQLDPFLSMAAVRAGVPLREKPAASARTVATLDWTLVERVLESARKDAGWIEVRAPGGKRGWVRAGDVRSSVDWRAGFRKTGGDWKLAALVSGD